MAGSHLDTLAPNTKYYYCARAVDIHGNVSNPTYIYEIEMVDNNGQVFLTQNIFTFETTEQKFIKSGQQFILIEPSLQQMLYNSSVDPGTPGLTFAPNSNILGGAEVEDSVWGKEFKVRITSKKTGRKLDLNINFKNTGIVNPSE